MKNSGQRILVSPDEILIDSLDIGKPFVETVQLTNTLSVPVNIDISAQTSSDRKHEIIPSSLRLSPRETLPITIKSTLSKYPRIGYYIRDVVQLKSDYFTEKFYISIKPKTYSKSFQESSNSHKKIEKLEDEIRAYDEEIESLHEKFLEKSHAENEMSRLSKENSELKTALDEAHRGSHYSQKMNDLYKEKASVEQIVEMRLLEEKERNDRKNAKVLQVLKQKDEVIQEREKNVERLNEKIAELHDKLFNAKKDIEKLRSVEESTEEMEKTVQDQQNLIEELKMQIKSFKEMQKINEELKKKVEKSEDLVKELREENHRLKNREQGILSLSTVQEMVKNRNEALNSEKDLIISDLRAKVRSQSNFIEMILSTSQSHQAILSKLLSLESENQHLCAQLAGISIPSKPPQISNPESLEFELSLKNQEIISLQNQILSLSKNSQSDSVQILLLSEQSKNSSLQKTINEQSELITTLEASNKDLQSQLNNLLQGANSEAFIQSLASQTQLVSRLNSRLMQLKDREEQALKKLSESEELIKKLKKVVNFEEIPKKSVKSTSVQVEDLNEGQEGLNLWDTLEKMRYQRKIAELDRETCDLHDKFYEKVKENHLIVEEFSRVQVEKVEDSVKVQKEVLELNEKGELMHQEINYLRNTLRDVESTAQDLRDKKRNLEMQNLAMDNYYKGVIAEFEGEIREFKLEIALKESCLQERTAQVAILMENIEGSSEREELLIKLSHFKAVEGSLNRQIIELKAINQDLSSNLSQESKTTDSLKEKLENQRNLIENQEKTIQNLQENIEDLKNQLKSKISEISILSVSLSRNKDSEKELKNRIEIYTQRINQLQKSFSSDLVKEREAFQEELMRIREEAEPFDFELNFHRPLIKSINNLMISLNTSKLTSVEFNEKIKELILEGDKQLFEYQKKIKELEFSIKNNEFFRFLDPDNIELVQKMKTLIFELSSELEICKNPKNMPNPEIYSKRIKLLESELQERTSLVCQLESELSEAKKNIQILSTSLNSSKLRQKSEEIQDFLKERNLIEKCEQEIRGRLKSRDEEIRIYLDSHLTKVLLNSPDSERVLELTREISSLKMIINDLEVQLKKECKNNESLQKSFAELSELAYQSDKQEMTVNISQNAELLVQLELKSQEIHKLKEANEHRKEENAFLQMKLADLKKELASSGRIDLDFKKREENLLKELKDLKERHRREVQTIKINSQELLQAKIEEIENSSSFNWKKQHEDEKDQEKIKALMEENSRMLNEFEEMAEELKSWEGKVQVLTENHNRVREELEIYKVAVQEGMNLNTEDVRTGKKTEKKLSLEKAKSSTIFRLVRALIASKTAEKNYLKQLKNLDENFKDQRNSAFETRDKFELLSMQMEKLVKYLKVQKVPIPEIGNFEFQDFRKDEEIEVLRSQVKSLQEVNSQAFQSVVPLSHKLDPVCFTGSEAGDVLESIVFLCNQLAEEDPTPCKSLEKVQRQVIHSLHNSLKSFLKPSEPLSSLLDFKPSHKEDTKLWYVELIETQSDKFSSTVSKLIDFVQKTSVDVSGNLLSTAQYKGAALELAQNLKTAASELETLQNICFLLRTDLTELKSSSNFTDYKERAFLAEALKRKLEEEILKLKVEQSYKLAEIQEFVTFLQDENEKLKEAQDKSGLIVQDKDKESVKIKSHVNRLELELKQFSEKYSTLDKTCNDLIEAKDVLVKRNEKLVKEQKVKFAEMNEQALAKDRVLAEVQKQNKILSDERAKIQQESTAVKKMNRELKCELENVKNLRETEKEIKELRLVKREGEEIKADMKRLVDSHKREMEQVLVVISGLEDKNKTLRAKYKKAKNYITAKVKNREEDAELLRHTFNAQMITVKNESKERIKDLTSQVNNLQTLLKEKLLETDQDSKKRLENEEKQKNLQFLEIDSQRKIAVLEEKLKNQSTLFEQETKKLSQELEKSRNEHSKLILKLQENFTSAEILADFISKSEQEKKSLDASYKSEISSLHKKEREKDSLIDSLKKKLEETIEKVKVFELKMFEFNSLTKEVEDLKFRVNELNNTKAQQRVKIREAEAKVRELEALKETEKNLFEEKFELVRREAQIAFEEFEKTNARLEGIIEGLKEQFALDLKRLKCPKKAVESLDFMFQIAKRDGLIKALRHEIKMKCKKDVRQGSVNEQVAILQTQVFKAKGTAKNLEAQLIEVRNENQRLKEEIDLNMKINEDCNEKFLEREKKHRAEVKAMLEDHNRLLYSKSNTTL